MVGPHVKNFRRFSWCGFEKAFASGADLTQNDDVETLRRVLRKT